jgi:hypothetical protein
VLGEMTEEEIGALIQQTVHELEGTA